MVIELVQIEQLIRRSVKCNTNGYDPEGSVLDVSGVGGAVLVVWRARLRWGRGFDSLRAACQRVLVRMGFLQVTLGSVVWARCRAPGGRDDGDGTRNGWPFAVWVRKDDGTRRQVARWIPHEVGRDCSGVSILINLRNGACRRHAHAPVDKHPTISGHIESDDPADRADRHGHRQPVGGPAN